MTNIILVVDDDHLVRRQLCELLQAAGYRVLEASSGEEALAICTQQQPDMVLLDALMPGMDGFSCCAQLKSLPGGDRTPVLMVTGLAEQESIEKAFAAGAADFITKPIKWPILRQRVQRLLEAYQVMQALRQQTEQAQMREMQLRMALEAAHMGAWDWNIQTKKVSWSDNLEALFGLEKGTFDGTYETFINCVHPEDRDLVNRSIRQAIEEGAEYDIEFRVVFPNGSIRWAGTKGVVFRDASGNPVRMCGVDIDITKRKQTEKTLEIHANQQALVAEISQVALAGTDLTSLMQQAVTFVAQVLEVEYCKAWELLPDNNTLLLRAAVGWQQEFVGKATINAGSNSQAGYTLVVNEPVVVEDLRTETRFHSSPFLQEQPLVSSLSVVIHGKERSFGVLGAHTTQHRTFSRDDIYFLQAIANVLATAIERHRTEDELKKMSTALSNAVEGISQLDVQGRYLMVNQAYASAVGYEPEEMIGMAWQRTVHPEDIEMIMAAYQQILNAGKVEAEARGIRKDGSIIYNQITMIAAYNNQKQLVGNYCFMKDISDRKQSEQALRQSEERFQILARATTDVVWDWNLLTDQVWWNENVQILFGYFPEESRNNTNWWYECIHPDDRQRIIADIHAVIDSRQQFWFNEYRFCRSDGSYAYIFDRGYVVHDGTGNPVRMIGAMMDISERKLVQEELQRQNMRSRLFADITLKIRQSLQIDEILQTSVTEVQKLLHADRVLVFRLRPDGSGTVVKEAVVPGTPMILGRNIMDVCFKEDYIEKYRRGRISAIEDITQADLQPCHVEFLQGLSVKANLVVPIMMQNQLWGLLIAHQCADPRHWDQWETELLRQLADQIGIALAQAKLLEQETKQRQELSRSNEELQEFAFVASHDLQEPLRKIKTFSDRLKASCGDAFNQQERDYLERMQNAARRMQTLIEDLLSLSRVTTRAQPFVAVDLLQVTQEVLSDLEISIQQTGAVIEIGELPNIEADPLQMRQLLQNLIGNALKFHRKEVEPVVKIYSQLLSEPEDVSAEQCQIIVEDNGIGFNEKYLDRIFNVFQRLHGRSEYDGTGIGLAICRKIVERHQGSITARSEPGQGAKFIVALPIHPHS
jgi:PAS domain S-box-containing protein